MQRSQLWVAMLAGVVLCVAGCEPRPGELRERKEFSSDGLRVRIEVYDEGNRAHMFEPGCHLRWLSAPAGSESWRQFARAYSSKCDRAFEHSVQFVNDEVAYVYDQWWYVVTVDGGRSWRTWDVPAHLPGRALYASELIDSVSIGGDGRGTMVLNPAGTTSKERLTLSTENFGVEWTTQ